MGTDIHYNLERWVPAKQGGNGTWEVFYSSELEREATYEECKEHWDGPLYIHRNYTLFGILCGIRSGIKPIAYPKGLPAGNDGGDYKSKAFSYGDVSDHVYHSASWLTIREIMDYEGFQTNCDLIQPMLRFTTIWLPEVLKYGKPEELRIVFCFDS
jgi:hypothetical protein